MPPRVKANVNPGVLFWARKTSGYYLEDAAHKIGISPEKLQAWENGADKPTMHQLRNISNAYKRPSALFYRKSVPADPPALADYRTIPDMDQKSTPQLLFEIRRAFERRAIAMELTTQLGEEIVEFPLKANITENPEMLAVRIRELLGISFAEQFSWHDQYTAFKKWMVAIEALGVFVFHARNIEVAQMRGFSISEYPFPVIGINAKDSPRGRIFTLMHELVHLALGNGGICDLYSNGHEQSIEVYCNRVAGEILVPRNALLKEQMLSSNTAEEEWADSQLQFLSNRYMVSREVILRRLLILGRTSQIFYSQKRDEYEESYRRERQETSGYVPYFRLIMRDNGPAYTNLILAAYRNEAIGPRDLSNYLGGVKLEHVNKIESVLTGGGMGAEI